MRKAVLIFLLLFSMLIPLYSEADEISFDDLDTEEENTPIMDLTGINFRLYSDFTLYGSMSEQIEDGNKSWTPGLEFGQNHFNVMGEMGIADFSASFDISASSRFLELSYNTDNITLTLGKIFIPFGSSEYHHIYGGYADESGTFVPFFWTDYGVKAVFKLNELFSIDTGITNGFRVYQGRPVFSSSPSGENNLMKAVNLRINFTPALTTQGSISVMFDSFSDDDEYIWEDSILLYGLDFSQRIKALTLKGGAAIGEVRIHDEGMGAQLILPLTYYRSGWYAEAAYDFKIFKLRFRTGGLDPDSRELDYRDAVNFNTGFIVPLGPFEWQTVYFYNYPLGAAVSGSTGMSHKIMTKLLIRL